MTYVFVWHSYFLPQFQCNNSIYYFNNYLLLFLHNTVVKFSLSACVIFCGFIVANYFDNSLVRQLGIFFYKDCCKWIDETVKGVRASRSLRLQVTHETLKQLCGPISCLSVWPSTSWTADSDAVNYMYCISLTVY